MLELRERNGKKNFLSNDELAAFAWAGYYTNSSSVFVNNRKYEVAHVTDSTIVLSNGTNLAIGCYVIFRNNEELVILDDYKLRNIRKDNHLYHKFVCFTDEQFYESGWKEYEEK